MISRLLIANRGEIAVRIARSARRLGIFTVGVYSEPDRNALHTDAVDLAVALGGATPAESYLRGEAIIQAALDTGATAVHPGYGFLAENAEFAEAVIERGLVWVGPTPEQIRLLGDKVAAKRAAVEAGVPTTQIIEVAPGEVPTDVPIPALVKAASGGGGRGMRIVNDVSELADALEEASREAAAAFGDGTVFIEPFVRSGHHIEVQILGDQHGNIIHLGDRECSIQRRNQKVVEEAPAPGIDDATRHRLYEGALALARHVGYVGVGTVEFMVGESGDEEPTITFLEVNTRLQVEHPVTEAITGIDLVAAQLAVADGWPLPFAQEDVTFEGHAIEVRVVAEIPSAGWLPSTGTLTEFEIDTIDGTIRIDAGFRAGSIVSPDYDSLLAKVIAHDSDRTVAAQRIERAMRTARIGGVHTNADMLAATMAEPAFLAGRTLTSYLGDHPQVVGQRGPVGDDRTALVLGATFADEHDHRSADTVTGFAPSGWRSLRTRGQRRAWIDGATTHHVEYHLDGATAEVLLGSWPEPDPIDGSLSEDARRRVEVRLIDRAVDRLVVELDGQRHAIRVRFHGDDVLVSSSSGAIVLTRPARFVDHDDIIVAGGPICPLPGTVIAVHVVVGDSVVQGQLLMVVEAMKMEHKIVAGSDATVIETRFGVGDRVDSGELLVVLDDTVDQSDTKDAGT